MVDDRDRELQRLAELVQETSEPLQAAPGVSIQGRNVVIGDHATIAERVVHRTKAVPGPHHISEAHKRKLRELVEECVRRDAGADRSLAQRYARKWWSALAKQFRVGTYHFIPAEKGEEAIAWMQQNRAKLRGRLRRTDHQGWRDSFLPGIYGRAKELGMSKGDILALVHERLGLRVISLRSLSDRNLERLYQVIMSLPRPPS